jgi:uncharacterized protein YdhG (YjbR/CyaY superfamily)
MMSGMKKTGSGNAAARGGGAARSVEEYLERVTEPARGTIEKVRAAIRAAAPEGTTEGISYGMPMFKYQGVLMWYAAFSGHCSLFPGSMAVMKEFEKELAGYETSKGTIRFPVDKALPAGLVRKLVKAKVKENEARKKR